MEGRACFGLQLEESVMAEKSKVAEQAAGSHTASPVRTE